MESYINEYNKIVYKDASLTDKLEESLFHKVNNIETRFEIEYYQIAFHSNLGSITILDRLTGFGWSDIETGYRDREGNFWLASGNFNILEEGKETIGEAIDWIKKKANTCIGE